MITSSMKTTAGCRSLATANKALTIFSPSPTYLEVREDAEMLKKVYPLSVATAFASIVLPVPGDRRKARMCKRQDLRRAVVRGDVRRGVGWAVGVQLGWKKRIEHNPSGMSADTYSQGLPSALLTLLDLN